MVIYFTLAEDGYVNGWGSTPSGDPDEISFDLPPSHDFFQSDSSVFKHVDGELIKDEEKQQKLIVEAERDQAKPSENEVLALALMDLAEIVMGGGE